MAMLTLLGGGAYAGVAPYAVDYDGAGDYGTRGANLTGAADGKQVTVSAWLRLDTGADGAGIWVFGFDGTSIENRFVLYKDADNKFKLLGLNAAGTIILFVATAATFTAGATWRHVLASFDMADSGKRHLYINDVSDLAVTTYTDDSIDFTAGNVGVGYKPANATVFWNGCISELFCHTTYIDLSVTANRRKFITAAGKPANLGTNGSAPLGVQPLLYLPTGDPSANRGSGGDFTVTGTLDAASTTPFS